MAPSAPQRAPNRTPLELCADGTALPPAAEMQTVGGYDAVLLLSFGGPERPEDVMPFLRRVTAGRGVPDERLAEVAGQYDALGGRSPINDQCRALLGALRAELDAHGLALPLYWGNRNWHPLLADTVATMAADGVERGLVFTTSAYASYASCRQYLENLAAARAGVDGAPELHKLRPFYDHPGFVHPIAERTSAALAGLSTELRRDARLVFTAHSIPTAMAATSAYQAQLGETARLVADLVRSETASGPCAAWDLVFQSRSGGPQVPWLGPDVNDHLQHLAGEGCPAVVLVPIGFVSDHMEVVFDLDVTAAATARRLGLPMVRAATVGTHPRFVAMIRELIAEQAYGLPRLGLGALRPRSDECQAGCCLPPAGHR